MTAIWDTLTIYNPLVVLGSIFPRNLATTIFLGGLAFGVILYGFIRQREKKLWFFAGPLLVYAVCEGIATLIFHGRMYALTAIVIGALALGWGLGTMLCVGVGRLRRR
ncbi:MAG: hypothetical protein HFF00_08195 [Ruminiclostridium sp.]|jgi:hypothetical protein|nr:hypothetical protein [Ruminiclostridium sp.]